MKKTLYRLENYYKNNATDVEKPVIRYILDNPREVASTDIHTLAKECYCSAATIVRICKKNGFSGFKEVKLAILNDLNFNDEIFRENYSNFDNEGTNSVVLKVLKQNVDAINNTYSLIDFSDLEIIIKLIDKAKVIRLFGIGASFLVAKDFQQKLERINKLSVLYEDTHLQLVSATNISKDEIAFVISYSGLTREILEMVENIKSNGAKIIAITKYNNNKLMKLADYNLFVPNIESALRISASSSRISQLCVIDIIYNSYIENVREKYINNIVDTSKLLEKDET